MKTLYLLRHAHAEQAAAVSMGDHERTLTPGGEREADAQGLHLRQQGVTPDFILGSSSVRTIQTARIVMARLLTMEGQKINAHFDRTLYLASAGELLKQIEEVEAGVDTLLVVAHNPGIAELASYLGSDARDFPTAGLATFTSKIDSWKNLGPETVKFVSMSGP